MDIASAAKEVSLSNTLQRFLSADSQQTGSEPSSNTQQQPDPVGPFAKESSGKESEQVCFSSSFPSN